MALVYTFARADRLDGCRRTRANHVRRRPALPDPVTKVADPGAKAHSPAELVALRGPRGTPGAERRPSKPPAPGRERWKTDHSIFVIGQMMAHQTLDAILAPAGMTFDKLCDYGNAYQIYDYCKYEKGIWRNGEPGFNTPTSKLELYSAVFEVSGLDPLPSFHEPNFEPDVRAR